MPDITEVSQEKDSSDCGFFCAYITAEINRGINPLRIDFTRDDVYRFRNRHMGLSISGKSPSDYVGLNAPQMMPVLLSNAGVFSYEVRRHDTGSRNDFLNQNAPTDNRDTLLLSLPAQQHWMMIIGPEHNNQRFVYDSAKLWGKGHLFTVNSTELGNTFSYVTHVVARN